MRHLRQNSELEVVLWAGLLCVLTGVVDQGIEPAELGLHFIECALDRFVVLDIDLDGPDFTVSGWEFFHDGIGCLFGFGNGSSAKKYLVGCLRATKRFDHFEAEASVCSRY